MTPAVGSTRRLLTVLLAVLLSGLLSGVVAAVATFADGSPAAAQTGPAPTTPPSITLVGRSPWVAPNGTFELDIATSGDAQSSLLQVRIHSRLDSVEDLERSLEEDVGRVIHRSPAVPVGFVPAGADGSRTVRVPTSTTTAGSTTALLPEPGVYPLVLTLADGSGVVSEIRTPVVRLGSEDEPLAAPRVELVADVSVPPTIEADGRRALEDDELDRLGRLAALLDGTAFADPDDRLPDVGPLDVTVAVTADTLEALIASADERAASMLDVLTATPETGSAADRTALGLPTVPLSAPAMVDADLDLFLLALLQSGRETLDDRLDAEIDTTVWDAVDGIDEQSATLLWEIGITRVLLDAPTAGTDTAAVERPLVDAGPYPIDEIAPMEALLVDRATSNALTSPAVDRVDAPHLALADLLLRDDGEGSRLVLRIDDAPSDSLLIPTLGLLTAPGSPVEVGPVSAIEQPDDEPALGPGDEIPLPEASTDLTDIAPRVRNTTADVDSFASLLGIESARADALRHQIATSIASGIDDDRRDALLDAVAADVDEAFDGVFLTGQTDLNLTSRSGTLPLQVRNENDFPVRVVLRISSDRLRFPEGAEFEIEASEEVTRVDIPVRAQATGSVPTFVRITTPDGRVVLDERRLDVRSTAISGVGLALSLGALAVLIIWWARTWRRNSRSE